MKDIESFDSSVDARNAHINGLVESIRPYMELAFQGSLLTRIEVCSGPVEAIRFTRYGAKPTFALSKHPGIAAIHGVILWMQVESKRRKIVFDKVVEGPFLAMCQLIQANSSGLLTSHLQSYAERAANLDISASSSKLRLERGFWNVVMTSCLSNHSPHYLLFSGEQEQIIREAKDALRGLSMERHIEQMRAALQFQLKLMAAYEEVAVKHRANDGSPRAVNWQFWNRRH